MEKQKGRKMRDDKHVIDLIPAYVLGCLDEAEQQLVSNHIHICKACRREVVGYQSIVFQLGHTVPAAEPSPRVKTAVLKTTNASHSEDGITHRKKWGRFNLRFVTPAWSAVAAILILILGAGNLLLWKQVRNLRHETQSVDAHFISLKGTEGAPVAHGYIYISDDGKEGTLIAEDLPVLDQKHQYQLWLIHDGSRTSGGVFSVSDDGYGSLRIISLHPLDYYSSFGVSIEPFGGSQAPTGSKVLGGSLTNSQ